MQIHTAADVTGDGAAHKLSTIAGANRAAWISISAVSVGAVQARIGGSDVASNKGLPIGTNGAQFLPPSQDLTSRYDLDAIYILIAVGDTVSVCCGS